MEAFVLYWGPTLFLAVVLAAAVRLILTRYTRFFTRQAENAANQTAELMEIRRSLDRIAATLETSVAAGRDPASN